MLDDELAALAKQNFCTTAADFLEPRAREIINDICRPFLEGKKACALELLHSASLQTAFQNSGSLQATLVQKIAISQIQNTSHNVQDRIKALNTLIDEFYKRNWNAQKEGKREPITPENASAFIENLLKTEPGFERDFIAYAALTESLKTADSVAEKIRILLSLVKHSEDAEWAGYIDHYISDYLYCASFWQECFDGLESNEPKIMILLSLSQGRGTELDIDFRHKSLLLELQGPAFRQSQSALRKELQYALTTRNHIFSKDVYIEAQKTQDLIMGLTRKDDPAMNSDLIQSLQARLKRSLDYEKGVSVSQRVGILY